MKLIKLLCVFVCILFFAACSSSDDVKKISEVDNENSVKRALAVQNNINSIVLDVNSSSNENKALKVGDGEETCPSVTFDINEDDFSYSMLLDYSVASCDSLSLSGIIEFIQNMSEQSSIINYNNKLIVCIPEWYIVFD